MKKIILLLVLIVFIFGCTDTQTSYYKNKEDLGETNKLDYEIQRAEKVVGAEPVVYISSFYNTTIKDDNLIIKVFEFPFSYTYDSWNMVVSSKYYDTSTKCYVYYFDGYEDSTYHDDCMYTGKDTWYFNFDVVIENNKNKPLEDVEISINPNAQIGFTSGGIFDKSTEFEYGTRRFGGKAYKKILMINANSKAYATVIIEDLNVNDYVIIVTSKGKILKQININVDYRTGLMSYYNTISPEASMWKPINDVDNKLEWIYIVGNFTNEGSVPVRLEGISVECDDFSMGPFELGNVIIYPGDKLTIKDKSFNMEQDNIICSGNLEWSLHLAHTTEEYPPYPKSHPNYR